MTTLRVPDSMTDADSVEVMAGYLDEPIRVDVVDGVPMDDRNNRFSTDSYWVVADSAR